MKNGGGKIRGQRTDFGGQESDVERQNKLNQARGYGRKRRLGTQLNHTIGSPRPRSRDRMSGLGRPADKRSRERVTRRAPRLPGGSAVNSEIGDRGRSAVRMSITPMEELAGEEVPAQPCASHLGVRLIGGPSIR